MRYEPYADEYAAVPNMDDEELFEYFLFRILETDEIWGLQDGTHWLTREIDGQETMPVWPFKRFASEAAVGDWQTMTPSAQSLESFLYYVLPTRAEQGVMVEVMPRGSAVGCLVKPRRLLTILENTMHAGEYMLDD